MRGCAKKAEPFIPAQDASLSLKVTLAVAQAAKQDGKSPLAENR